MKAIRIHENGGPEVLRYDDIPVPEPATGQVLIRTHAIGVNYVDIYQRDGLYKLELPFIAGSEAAGVVEAVGDGVTGLVKGDGVAFGTHRGSYAEYIAAPASVVVKIPDAVTFEQAAAAMLQGMTAQYLTHSTFPLTKDHTCLIHAAAGGAGGLIVQMAKLRGARVIGTTSTGEKAKVAKAHGCDEVILYTKADFAAEARRLTDGKGVHVVYDSVGASTFDKSIDSLRPLGMMVTFGNASGPVPPVPPALLGAKGSLFLTRPSLFHYAAERADLEWRASDVLGWVAAGKLKVPIGKSYPLSDAKQAHIDLASRGTTGKLLLDSEPPIMTTTEFAERKRQFAQSLAEQKLDVALVASPVNVRYLTGFTGSNSMLVITPTTSVLFTDPRYTIQVNQEADAKQKKVVRGPLLVKVAEWLKAKKSRWIGVEAGHFTYASLQTLDEKLPKRSRIVPLENSLEKQRAVKSAGEIAKIRHSVDLNSQAFERALKALKPTLTEAGFAAEIDHQMRKLGAEQTAFETIVASGKHSALPHAKPRSAAIGEHAIVLVDMGAQVDGYMSDMTRMAHLGKPSQRFTDLHAAVLESQLAGIAAVRAGAKAGDIDKAARKPLKRAGLDKYFVHSTGHGLGLEIHEGPRLGKKEETELEAGMVITIEPGAYIEGFGGVRIEDTVLVTATGCEILTPTPKELRILSPDQ